MFQDSPLPPTCLDLPRHSLSTGDSREAPVDKRAHQDANSSYSRIACLQDTKAWTPKTRYLAQLSTAHFFENDTCAWTPNKVFIQCVLVSVETARVLLQSLWARLSTGASREAPVDNECLGKSRQVGDDGKSWSTGYLEHLQRTFCYFKAYAIPPTPLHGGLQTVSIKSCSIASCE